MELRTGDVVVLLGVPGGLVDGLPAEDQDAILRAVGREVTFTGWDDFGRAEVQFVDEGGVIHFIYLDPSFLGVQGSDCP